MWIEYSLICKCAEEALSGYQTIFEGIGFVRPIKNKVQ